MIRFRGFTFWYPGHSAPALEDIDLEFQDQETVLLSGPNGSGKSTLLSAILGIVPRLTDGTVSGEVSFAGRPVTQFQISQLAGHIGIVLQDPESQVSNLTVWDEATFGPSNLCLSEQEVRSSSLEALRAMQMAHLRSTSVLALSGGQLQRLSLACLLAMRPEVVLLDEPMANLDPWGVADVVVALRTLQARVRVVVIASHWLDPFLEFGTRVVLLDQGHVVGDFPSKDLYQHVKELVSNKVEVPEICRIYEALRLQGVHLEPSLDLPVLDSSTGLHSVSERRVRGSAALVKLSHVSYQYPSGETPLVDISISVSDRDNTVLAGRNGAGKSTLARLLVGLREPTRGTMHSLVKKAALMVQRPALGFLGTTVSEEIGYGAALSLGDVEILLERFSLSDLRDQSPFHISGGEQRRLSLAASLAQRPDLLVLDEPTAGLDAYQVRAFLQALEDEPVSVLYITHDTRVVAKVERVVALREGGVAFDGSVTALDSQIASYLGYQHVSATVSLALRSLDRGIPIVPEQIQVVHANSVS